MLRNADCVPVVLREASGCRTLIGWTREGERAPEDILTRLADGKRRIEENEFELFSYGKAFFFRIHFLFVRNFITFLFCKLPMIYIPQYYPLLHLYFSITIGQLSTNI